MNRQDAKRTKIINHKGHEGHKGKTKSRITIHESRQFGTAKSAKHTRRDKDNNRTAKTPR